jgi:hypothetical protein
MIFRRRVSKHYKNQQKRLRNFTLNRLTTLSIFLFFLLASLGVDHLHSPLSPPPPDTLGVLFMGIRTEMEEKFDPPPLLFLLPPLKVGCSNFDIFEKINLKRL